jgi:hypothetical protein
VASIASSDLTEPTTSRWGGPAGGQFCAPPARPLTAQSRIRKATGPDTRNLFRVSLSLRNCRFAGTSDAGGGTRTPDTRIMIPRRLALQSKNRGWGTREGTPLAVTPARTTDVTIDGKTDQALNLVTRVSDTSYASIASRTSANLDGMDAMDDLDVATDVVTRFVGDDGLLGSASNTSSARHQPRGRARTAAYRALPSSATPACTI